MTNQWMNQRKRKTLEEIDGGLNANIAFSVSLIGDDLERADLRGKDLRGADFTDANLRAADLSHANLTGCTMKRCDFSRASLYHTDFTDADVSGSDFTGAYMRRTKFLRTKAWACIFKRITGKGTLFVNTDLRKSDFHQAELLGAKFDGANTYRCKNFDTAQFVWWLSPYGGPHSDTPRPGWTPMMDSLLGTISIQENSSRQRVEDGE